MLNTFYDDPEVYDILHEPGTASDVRAVERIRRRYAPEAGGRWLEPACGTGRYVLHAAARGVDAVGFDLSPAMIAFARRRARVTRARARFFVADMEHFDQGRRLGRFGVVFNLINTIRHLGSDAAMVRHLDAVGRVLEPGGVYAVGLSLCAYGLEGPTEDVWRGSRAGVRVTQVVQYLPPAGGRGEAARTERVISHLTIRHGREESHRDSTYALRGYNLAQWRKLTADAGWRIAGVTDGAGAEARPAEPGYFIFVLRPEKAFSGSQRRG